jgi:AAA+ superfamily predicted ATPase
VADERGRQHHVMAKQLSAFLNGGPDAHGSAMRHISSTPDSLVDELHPERRLDELELSPSVLGACRELVEEQQRGELLRSHGLEPRHRVLLIGPPGNGKTSLAEALGAELALPVLRVRYDAVIGSFLGETATRLARVFDHARTRQCVLFFDEFDAVGKERGDEHETGEIKRVVNTLLLRIDALPAYVVVVAASNHPELLDRAAWRRFQLRLQLPAPKRADIIRWVRQFEERTGLALGIGEKVLSQSLGGLSYAELEEFCLDIQRRIVLDGPSADVAAIARVAVTRWRSRSGVDMA